MMNVSDSASTELKKVLESEKYNDSNLVILFQGYG